MKNIMSAVAVMFAAKSNLTPKIWRDKERRPCLNPECRQYHSHNNSFCSAACCNEYRGKHE